MTAEKKPAGKWHAVLRDDGKRYVSVAAAAASVACPKSSISAACRDGNMVGGHYFSYEEDGRRYACTYFGMNSINCDKCTIGDLSSCDSVAMRDIADRIRKLRGEGE